MSRKRGSATTAASWPRGRMAERILVGEARAASGAGSRRRGIDAHGADDDPHGHTSPRGRCVPVVGAAACGRRSAVRQALGRPASGPTSPAWERPTRRGSPHGTRSNRTRTRPASTHPDSLRPFRVDAQSPMTVDRSSLAIQLSRGTTFPSIPTRRSSPLLRRQASRSGPARIPSSQCTTR
jgi:hypothetical protein